MSSAEDLAVDVLRGAVDIHHGWPQDDQRAVISLWRRGSIGAVLVGRRLAAAEVLIDVVVCEHDGDDWHVLGSGGTSVDPSLTFGRRAEKVSWFYSQDVVFEAENGEEAYVSTFVGVAAPGVERLSLHFSNGARAEVTVTSDDRLVFLGLVNRSGDEITIQVR